MKLRQWLTTHNKNQSWLAAQLGVTKGRVSQAFKVQREGGELPRAWAVDIVHLTHGAVRIQDEWPSHIQKRAIRERAA